MSSDAHNEEEQRGDLVALFFTSEFKRNLRRLAKKYRHIRQDLQPLLDLLQAGQTPGTQIPRVRYAVYKVRVRNRDARSGTRGGYRMIYYVKTARHIVLITLYSKSEQGDVEVETIRTIIDRYEGERFGDA